MAYFNKSFVKNYSEYDLKLVYSMPYLKCYTCTTFAFIFLGIRLFDKSIIT